MDKKAGRNVIADSAPIDETRTRNPGSTLCVFPRSTN